MNLEQKIQIYLSPQAYEMVQSIVSVANSLKTPVYLVGGAVRDIMLGRMSHDLDFVTEGSGVNLAQAVEAELKGELIVHDRFGTAVWIPPHDLFDYTIDFITARKEVYPNAADLPHVTPSNMQDDLFRRDFTINAMAIRIDGESYGQLVDLYDGRTALDNRQITILHDASFRDDPTRMFRAARYSGRLGFPIAPSTLHTLTNSLGFLDSLSADRVRHEFEKILSELHPIPMVDLLKEWQVLTALEPSLTWHDSHRVALSHLEGLISTEPGVTAEKQVGREHLRFSAWLSNLKLDDSSFEKISARLNLPTSIKNDVEKVRRTMEQAKALRDDLRPGTLEKLFRKLTASQLVLLQTNQAFPKTIKSQIPRYFSEWRTTKTSADGNTLRDLGLPPGPSYQLILDQLLEEKLNGELQTTEDEHQRLKMLIDQLAP